MTILVNGYKIECFSFPGGERHLSLPEATIHYPGSVVKIKAFLRNSDDIMDLLLTVDAIRRIYPRIEIGLEIPYLPYARQDRVCNKGEPLSVSVFSKILNSLSLSYIKVFDMHSYVSGALINNLEHVSCRDIFYCDIISYDYIKDWRNLLLICPDAGAINRAYAICEDTRWEIIQCLKKRNSKTGEIEKTEIYGDVKGKRCLIVDDICDGGRTFIEISKKLIEGGASEIILYVTHGIFSKGLEVLVPFFKKIICFHTFLDRKEVEKHGEFLQVIERECFIR
jgi:ribose-phosphate pyrophosphokinase